VFSSTGPDGLQPIFKLVKVLPATGTVAIDWSGATLLNELRPP